MKIPIFLQKSHEKIPKVEDQLRTPSGSQVKVRYEGRLGSTGGRFDKGVIEFRLGMGEVIEGWDQGVLLGGISNPVTFFVVKIWEVRKIWGKIYGTIYGDGC